jgi:hypothetical protein
MDINPLDLMQFLIGGESKPSGSNLFKRQQ